jgi:hypothetical protein
MFYAFDDLLGVSNILVAGGDDEGNRPPSSSLPIYSKIA